MIGVAQPAADMTTSEATQIGLDFPAPPPDYRRQAYVVATSNAGVLKGLERWLEQADAPLLAIVGPGKSGKTHIAHIAASDLNCSVLDARDIDDLAHLDEESPLVMDDVDGIEKADLRALFSLVTARQSRRTKTVLVGAGDPGEWAGDLADLRTRLNASPRLTLQQPDEELLKLTIQKLFDDRQLKVDEKFAGFAAPRIPRTFNAAFRFVAECDRRSAANRTVINKKLAREVFSELSPGSARA